jgi:hypothetical protein
VSPSDDTLGAEDSTRVNECVMERESKRFERSLDNVMTIVTA